MSWAGGRLLNWCGDCATRPGTLHWNGPRFTAEAVEDGPLMLSLEREQDAQVRHGAGQYLSWQAASAGLRNRLGAFYATGLNRCR